MGLGVVLLAALAITLTPVPVDQGRADEVRAFLEVLHGLGISESFGYQQLEFTANVIMFLPLGFFFGLLGSGKRWLVAAILFPFVLSCGIELAQHLFLRERYADVSDIVANTIGGCIGVAFDRCTLLPRERA